MTKLDGTRTPTRSTTVMPTNPDTARDFHDPTDVFECFGVEGSPKVVGEPERIIYDAEDGYSVHIAACDDETIAIANVTTACAPEACQRTYTHLDRMTIVGLLSKLDQATGRVAYGEPS